MKLQRRSLLALGAGALLAGSGCSHLPGAGAATVQGTPPIVFVHGNGDHAALWQTTIWRFESNGWPRERLHAIDVPYPLARDDDSKPQDGRSSSAENMAWLKAEVERVIKASGAARVVLIANSRGGNAVRNYIQNGGGDQTVSHAILGGTPNHGVWAIKGFREGNEFSGTGPFLTALNAPRNAAGDEVTPGVRWLTVRSDRNDKFAQPDGLWIGAKGTPTNVGFDGPALKGAENVVIAGIDHRETSFSAAAFEAAWRFLTGRAPATTAVSPEPGGVATLDGMVSGQGLRSLDPASGNYVNNLPVPGARVQVWRTDPASGERLGAALHDKTVGADGRWGPCRVPTDASLEMVVEAAGYATTHVYRGPLPRSSAFVHLRAERLTAAERDAGAVVMLVRPRGYFDVQRDRMSLDGRSELPGVPPAGAGVAQSRLLLPEGGARTVSAEFNGERIAARSWPAKGQHLSILELTY